LCSHSEWLFGHGYLAVDFFFCLSGFVIAFAYEKRLRQRMTLADFALSRVFRLYPVVMAGMILGVLYLTAMVIGGHQPISLDTVMLAFSLNLFLIPYLGDSGSGLTTLYPINTPFWSLFFELLINLVWAAWLRRISPWLLFGVAAVLALAFFPLLPSMDVGDRAGNFLWGLLRVTLGFSAGIVVFRLYRAGFAARLPRVPAPLLLVVLTIVLALPGRNVWYDMLCAILIFPFITLLGAVAPTRVREERVLAWLGDVSYPLYGIHRPLCLAGMSVAARLFPSDALIPETILLGTIVSLVAATIVFHWFDVPVRRRLGALRRRPATTRVA
jgi:peptidoglycan/LPS O-acetylase OafA/YrhL